MAEKRHVQHSRSRVVEQNGQPKLPLASDLQYGEFAINYHKGTETVSFKNDNDEIVLFHDEVEISSGQPKVNTEIWIDTGDKSVTEIYTKQQIDSQVSGINNDIASVKSKNTEQDSRLQTLEEKTEEMTGDTISKINQAISELSGTVDTKVSQLEEKDEELRELAENAYEVQIGTSADTISANTKVFIDTEMDNTVEVYTKQQIDSQVSGINNDIASVKSKNTEQDSRLQTLEEKDAAQEARLDTVESLAKDNIIISDTTPSSNNTKLFVDTSNDGDLYEVYTKAQVNDLIADLQRQIDELKG